MKNSTITAGAMKTSGVAEIVPVQNTASIMEVISRAAADPNTDVSKLERLMDLHERLLARQAKADYSDALAQMQSELPVIEKRGKIDIGRGKPQPYALWEDINEAIKPVLAKHGFALSFRTGSTETKITVTGVLSHRAGHSEETTIQLPSDVSGSKNAVQAVGSSTSYGKRYTASALLNLTTRGEDDDGKSGTDAPITDEQATKIRDLLTKTKADLGRFLKYVGAESITDIPSSKFKDAMTLLQKKANAS